MIRGERLLIASRARRSFARWVALLEEAVGPVGSLAHVSPLVELCERDLQTIIEAVGVSIETHALRRQLDVMRGAEPAPARPSLRVIK